MLKSTGKMKDIKIEKRSVEEQTLRERETVIERLRERGCRITKQRLMLLDVILGEECSSCKEIFYKASNQQIPDDGVFRYAPLHGRMRVAKHGGV